MANGEIAYLLGLPVDLKRAGDVYINRANLHVIVSDVATEKWARSVMGDEERVRQYLEWATVESIVEKTRSGHNSSIEMYIYNGGGLDKNYDEMILNRGLADILQESIDKDIKELLLRYDWYGLDMTKVENGELEMTLMVLGRFYLEVRDE